MANINLSAAVRSNLSSLQNTATLMAKTSDRLSSGNKVNSALDNPTNFFTASSLNSRAGDLNQLMDSMANGIKTIEAADNGLSAITKNLESMQSTLRQARQDKSFQTSSFSIDATAIATGGTVKNLTLSGGAIGSTPVNLALNTAAVTGTPSALSGSATYAPGSAGTKSAVSLSANYSAPTAASGPTQAESTAANSFVALTTGQTASFKVNGTTVSLTDANAGNITDAMAAISTAIGTTDFTVAEDNGKIVISGKADGTNSVTITDVVNSGSGTPGFVVGDSSTGTAAQLANNLDFSVNGTAVSLTSANAGTLGDAVTAANTQLGAASAFEAYDNSGKLGIREKVANGAALTITGTDVGAFAAATNTGVAGDVLDLTVNGTAVSVAGGTALSAAVTSINSQLTTSHAFEAFDDAGKLAVSEKTANGAQLTIGGTDAASVFGTTLSNTGTASTAAAVKTVDQLVNEINGKTLPGSTTENPLYGKIRATNDNGKLRIENLSTTDLSITGADSSNTLNGGTGTNAITGNSVRSDLAKQFNDLRDTLDKLADDASFNGINLLRGDNLKITFNETGTSAIDILAKNGEAINSTSLKVKTDLTAKDLDSDTGIDGFLDQIKGALGKVRSQASAFGSNLSIVQNRQEFTKSMINTLETGAGNLTLADMNQEAANMMALQTRQSLASSTLSMANQADQGVLQLLR